MFFLRPPEAASKRTRVCFFGGEAAEKRERLFFGRYLVAKPQPNRLGQKGFGARPPNPFLYKPIGAKYNSPPWFRPCQVREKKKFESSFVRLNGSS